MDDSRATGSRFGARLVLAAVLTLALAGCATAPERSPWIDDAEAALAAGDRVSAVAFYEEALAETPTDPAVTTRLALLLTEEADAHRVAGDHALADDRYARADALAGSTALHTDALLAWVETKRRLGAEFQDVAPLLERAWQQAEPSERVEIGRTLALGWDREGEFDGALEWYHRLLPSLDAGDALPLQLRVGQLEAELGRSEDARSTLEAYLAASERAPAGLMALAELHETEGRVGEAESLRREVAELRPDSAAGWRQLLAFYQRTGNQGAVDEVAATIAALRARNQPAPRKMRPLRKR